jgi:peptidoglycan/LPS O-acetylase OafA/YrhL
MYLWQIPVLVATEHWHSSITQFPAWVRVGFLLLCVPLAAGSYSLYEMPIRHSERLRSSAALTLVAAVALIAVSLLAVHLVAQ